VRPLLVQLIAVLHLPRIVFASANGPLLSKQPTLKETLDGDLSVAKIEGKYHYMFAAFCLVYLINLGW
jgi:hypothetical protein